MKDAVANGRAKPHQIIADTFTSKPVEVRAVLGHTDTLKRTLRRHKRGHRPKQPASLQELDISDEWKTTGGENAQPFLIYDNECDAAERIIVFATDECLSYLSSNNHWFMDGTFSTAPALFQQLYVIRAALGETSIACVYAFMSSKSQGLYEELFRAINVRSNALGFDLYPRIITIDFELAVSNAISAIYGSDVKKAACFYHLTQSTWRKVQEFGLVTLYKTDADVRHFCGMMDGLAFLPLSDVSRGLAYLKTIVKEELVPLLDYFDQTYVSGPLRAIRQPQKNQRLPTIRMRRSNPLFPPELWNVNEATLNDEARTNNMCEAWNNGFLTTVGHHHPCVWKAIEAIRKDQAICSTLLYQNIRGEPPKKRVRREYKNLQQKLKKLCSDYRDGLCNMNSFISTIGHCIRVF